MRLVIPEGGIGNAEIEINGAVLMLANAALPNFPSNDTKIHLYVEDVDRVYAQAARAGAISVAEPADKFYGDRVARISDPCGNQWDIASHGEDVDMDEMLRRMPSMGHE